MDSKYLEFKFLEAKPKTSVYGVFSKSGGYRLAIIKWYPSWRCYSFFPEHDTIWNNGCLKDIIEFIEEIKSKPNDIQ